MRSFTLLGIFFTLLIPSYVAAMSLGDVRMSLIEGDVQINTGDTQEWIAASMNMPLKDGDRIWVPAGGKAELQLKNGAFVRIGESSSLDILGDERNPVRFHLHTGSVYVTSSARDGFFVSTPDSSVQTYQPAKFRVDVSETNFSEISVYKGAVFVENKNGKVNITAGKMLPYTGQTYADVRPLGPTDEWERWNRERDKRIPERYVGSRYLPEELAPYSRELDDNGRWVYVRDYGYCWTPTVIAYTGWAPYKHGRWAWIRGDYVWISYDPWGWAPFHYGRWAHVVSIGWVWVPPVRGAVYWGPGYVGWVYTPSYVAWVPLAPREIYYGRGHYGPYSINIIVNKTVEHHHAQVYRNVHVDRAVTTVSHDSFIKGRPVEVRVKDNIFVKSGNERVSFGRPEVRHERAGVSHEKRGITPISPNSSFDSQRVDQPRGRDQLNRGSRDISPRTGSVREVRPAERKEAQEQWRGPQRREVFTNRNLQRELRPPRENSAVQRGTDERNRVERFPQSRIGEIPSERQTTRQLQEAGPSTNRAQEREMGRPPERDRGDAIRGRNEERSREFSPRNDRGVPDMNAPAERGFRGREQRRSSIQNRRDMQRLSAFAQRGESVRQQQERSARVQERINTPRSMRAQDSRPLSRGSAGGSRGNVRTRGL